jgi:hypothetical protein
VPIRETITAFKFRTKKNVDNKIEKAAIAMFNLILRDKTWAKLSEQQS